LASQDEEYGVTYGPNLRNIDLDSNFTEHVVDHEFGHFLGLADNYTNPGDLMYYKGNQGATFPSQSDLVALVKQYSGR
jgi:hypothetical protein